MTALDGNAVHVEEVTLPAPRTRYEDALPLSDIRCAPTGAVCCARRVPGLAEVLVWPGGLEGKPESWTGPRALPIRTISGFDGNNVYAATEHEIVRVRPGSVDVLHASRAPVRDVGLSPDRRTLCWIEGIAGGRGYVATWTT